jgi:hypothetical protein
MMMYFIPASLAMRTHSSASNWVGLNCRASGAYSSPGIFARSWIHSPRPVTRSPFHVPAGDGVQAPVDEHPEARVAPPRHARVFLRSGLAGDALGVEDCRRGRRDEQRENEGSEAHEHHLGEDGRGRSVEGAATRRRARSYMAVKPPSTGRATPVMNDASSDTSQRAASAHSSALPSRPIGCAAS